MNTKNILVTGGRSPVALHLARILHENGNTIYVAESETYHLSKKSNVIKRSFVVPKPNDNHVNYIQALIQICKNYSIDLMIPTCEELFHISKSKEEFQKHNISVFCDNLDTLRLLHNKFTFYQYLKQNDYMYPKTYEFTSMKNLTEHFSKFSHQKMILKAVYSRFASDVYFTDGEIPHIQVSAENPWVLQQYIEGRQYCSYSVAVEGELIAHTCYPTVYTAGLGANVYFKHVIEPKIEEFVERIVKELNFTGQIAFDFIKDIEGDFYPIECNPRATSGLHLFDGCADFCSVFLEQKIQKRVTPTGNKVFKLGIPMLMYGLTEGFLFQRPRSFIKDFIHSKDVIYSSKDKMPYFYQGIILIVMLARKRKSGKGLTELTTTDIEWSGD
ncbi:ATP-grasp domain-containing protein [Halalkalibacter nanhaiisediminis]|uniref:Putative ATP-grasp superfamily ATP-dependent carboligase n=1 Tax=Halalkalibacter nanhaiisediminis TaxID=688079 RepID=A0A562QMT7_9BACI|nr:ATP-grasp domain-containing protein [Halalkalibacter nanhaiisediminis]TWI58068.1 putative ATP-grasp superfamily ATP-dependent carboligase [Halalkalibacter nanhaiisediminis]